MTHGPDGNKSSCLLSNVAYHTRSSQSKDPHVTKEIEQLLKEKRYAYRRFKKNPSPELRLHFTTIRNKVTARIRKAERTYASTLHRQAQLSPSQSTSRDFWYFVRNLTGKFQRKPPSLLIDPLSQQTFSTPESKANLLNRFFVEQTNLDVPANSKPDATSVPVNPCCFTYLETAPLAAAGCVQGAFHAEDTQSGWPR